MKLNKIILILISFLVTYLSRRKNRDVCDTPCGLGLICVKGKCIGTVVSGLVKSGKEVSRWKKFNK